MERDKRRDVAIRESRAAAWEFARHYGTTAIAYYQEHSGRWFVREPCDPRPDAAEELGRVVPRSKESGMGNIEFRNAGGTGLYHIFEAGVDTSIGFVTRTRRLGEVMWEARVHDGPEKVPGRTREEAALRLIKRVRG